MELRRALLLFGIVLAIAGVVTVVGNTRRHSDAPVVPATGVVPSAPQARPATALAAPRTLRFDASRVATTRTATVGQPVSVTVSVEEAGQVTIRGLGLTQPAEVVDPARFDVLASQPGTYGIDIVTAGQQTPRSVGTLRIAPAN